MTLDETSRVSPPTQCFLPISALFAFCLTAAFPWYTRLIHSTYESSIPTRQPSQIPSSPSCAIMALNGPLLTIRLITSNSASAAAIVVSSALVSYAGATSTMSAATKLMPSRPRRMVRSSRVDQPPVSGVPVAGATGMRQRVTIRGAAAQGVWLYMIRRAGFGQTYKRDLTCQYRCSYTQGSSCRLGP